MDESQLETSRSNVKMKTFKVVKQENETEEEAEKRTKKEVILWKETQEKTTGRIYSDSIVNLIVWWMCRSCN